MATLVKRPQEGKTGRFEQKRIDILDAAAVLINRHGARGMTFVDVARQVGLNTTSVTYYFKRKELLVAAALDHSLGRMEMMVDQASQAATPRDRVNAYLAIVFDLQARIRRGEDRPLAVLSDVRALEEPMRAELSARYAGIFAKLCNFFDGGDDEGRRRATAKAHVFVETVFWLPAWLNRYSVGDFDRVHARFRELLDHGIALEGAPWGPEPLSTAGLREPPGGGRPESFMRAATVLINQRGYRGASVERIAAELNVTKGSFYHHLEAKDDLVVECFRRSYDRVSLVQRAAMDTAGTHWHRLSSAMATLLDIQFNQPFPLLRTTALQALPTELRGAVLDRSNRMARRFAGMMIDGITEGTIRPIDPLVASQAVMAMVNAAFDLRRWAHQPGAANAIGDYAATIAYGLYADQAEVR